MSFFSAASDDSDDLVDDEREETLVPPAPWEGPPEGEVPVVLPVSALVCASEQAAIVLASARVFSNGIDLAIDAKARRGHLSEEEWEDLQDRVRGFGHRRSRRSSRSSRLRLGVVLADGSRVFADDLDMGGIDEQAAAPRLRPTGGSGSGGDRFWVSSWSYWLWPLPPDGPVTVVADWPQLGLEERSVVVDGSDLATIATRARSIWPDGNSAGRGPQPTWSITF